MITATTTAGLLEKLAGSKLRQLVKVVQDLEHPDTYKMLFNGRSIGEMSVDNLSRVHTNPMESRFRGLGLGKKLYGEVMRRQPGQRLKSDATTSEAAARVWLGMSKRPGYKLSIHPKAMHDPGREFGWTAPRLTPSGRHSERATFSASLPEKARIFGEEAPKAPRSYRKGSEVDKTSDRILEEVKRRGISVRELANETYGNWGS